MLSSVFAFDFNYQKNRTETITVAITIDAANQKINLKTPLNSYDYNTAIDLNASIDFNKSILITQADCPDINYFIYPLQQQIQLLDLNSFTTNMQNTTQGIQACATAFNDQNKFQNVIDSINAHLDNGIMPQKELFDTTYNQNRDLNAQVALRDANINILQILLEGAKKSESDCQVLNTTITSGQDDTLAIFAISLFALLAIAFYYANLHHGWIGGNKMKKV